MRNINFIQAVPEHRKKELRRWILLTSIVLASILISMSALFIMQWRIHRAIAQEKKQLAAQLKPYDHTMNTQRSKKEQANALQKKLATLQTYTDNPKNPIDIITSVQRVLASMPLQSLSISANHFELRGNCAHAKQVTQIVHKLNALPVCKHAQLIAISSHENDFSFAIKGSLI